MAFKTQSQKEIEAIIRKYNYKGDPITIDPLVGVTLPTRPDIRVPVRPYTRAYDPVGMSQRQIYQQAQYKKFYDAFLQSQNNKAQTLEEYQAYLQSQDNRAQLISNYDDPMQINSLADVIIGSITGSFGSRNPIKNFKEYFYRTLINPLRHGDWKAAGINTLIDLGETLETFSFAPIIKGAFPLNDKDREKFQKDLERDKHLFTNNYVIGIDGRLHFVKFDVPAYFKWLIKTQWAPKVLSAYGLNGTKGRQNLDWDTGSLPKDIFLELISDPAILLTGVKTLVNFKTSNVGGKLVRQASGSAGDAFIQEFNKKFGPRVYQHIADTLENAGQKSTNALARKVLTSSAEGLREKIINTEFRKLYRKAARAFQAGEVDTMGKALQDAALTRASHKIFKFADQPISQAFIDALPNFDNIAKGSMTLKVLEGVQAMIAPIEKTEAFLAKLAFSKGMYPAWWVMKKAADPFSTFVSKHIGNALKQGKLITSDGTIRLNNLDEVVDVLKKATTEANLASKFDKPLNEVPIKELKKQARLLQKTVKDIDVAPEVYATLIRQSLLMDQNELFKILENKNKDAYTLLEEVSNYIFKKHDGMSLEEYLTMLKTEDAKLNGAFKYYTETLTKQIEHLQKRIEVKQAEPLLKMTETTSSIRSFIQNEIPEEFFKLSGQIPENAAATRIVQETAVQMAELTNRVEFEILNPLKQSEAYIQDIGGYRILVDTIEETLQNVILGYKSKQDAIADLIALDELYAPQIAKIKANLPPALLTNEQKYINRVLANAYEAEKKVIDLTLKIQSKVGGIENIASDITVAQTQLTEILQKETKLIAELGKQGLSKEIAKLLHTSDMTTYTDNFFAIQRVLNAAGTPEAQELLNILQQYTPHNIANNQLLIEAMGTVVQLKLENATQSLILCSNEVLNSSLKDIANQVNFGEVINNFLNLPADTAFEGAKEYLVQVQRLSEAHQKYLWLINEIAETPYSETTRNALLTTIQKWADKSSVEMYSNFEQYVRDILTEMELHVNGKRMKESFALEIFAQKYENKLPKKALHTAAYDVQVTEQIMLNELSDKFDPNTLYIIFDIETTGLETYQGATLEIAYKIYGQDGVTSLIRKIDDVELETSLPSQRMLNKRYPGKTYEQQIELFKKDFAEGLSEEEMYLEFNRVLLDLQKQGKPIQFVTHNGEKFDINWVRQRMHQTKNSSDLFDSLPKQDTLQLLREKAGYYALSLSDRQNIYNTLLNYTSAMLPKDTGRWLHPANEALSNALIQSASELMKGSVDEYTAQAVETLRRYANSIITNLKVIEERNTALSKLYVDTGLFKDVKAQQLFVEYLQKTLGLTVDEVIEQFGEYLNMAKLIDVASDGINSVGFKNVIDPPLVLEYFKFPAGTTLDRDQMIAYTTFAQGVDYLKRNAKNVEFLDNTTVVYHTPTGQLVLGEPTSQEIVLNKLIKEEISYKEVIPEILQGIAARFGTDDYEFLNYLRLDKVPTLDSWAMLQHFYNTEKKLVRSITEQLNDFAPLEMLPAGIYQLLEAPNQVLYKPTVVQFLKEQSKPEAYRIMQSIFADKTAKFTAYGTNLDKTENLYMPKMQAYNQALQQANETLNWYNEVFTNIPEANVLLNDFSDWIYLQELNNVLTLTDENLLSLIVYYAPWFEFDTRIVNKHIAFKETIVNFLARKKQLESLGLIMQTDGTRVRLGLKKGNKLDVISNVDDELEYYLNGKLITKPEMPDLFTGIEGFLKYNNIRLNDLEVLDRLPYNINKEARTLLESVANTSNEVYKTRTKYKLFDLFNKANMPLTVQEIESLMKQYQTYYAVRHVQELLDRLKPIRESINLFSGYRGIGSTSEIVERSFYQDLYQGLPDAFKNELIDLSEIISDKYFQETRFNFTNLGDYASRSERHEYAVRNLMSGYIHNLERAADKADDAITYTQLFYNTENSINRGWMKNATNKEIQDALKASPEFVLAAVVQDSKTITGVRVVSLNPASTEMIETARKLNAVVMPYTTYISTVKAINSNRYNTGLVSRFWKRIQYIYNMGYLINPDTWLNNLIDSTMKNMISTDSVVEPVTTSMVAKRYLNRYDKAVQDIIELYGDKTISPQEMSKAQINAAILRIKYEQAMDNILLMDSAKKFKWENADFYFEKMNPALDKETFMFVHEMRQINGTGMTQAWKNQYTHTGELAAQKTYKGLKGWAQKQIDDFKAIGQITKETIAQKGLEEGVWIGIVHLMNKLTSPMSTIEEVVRLADAMLLAERGFNTSQIGYRIAKTHFEYAVKSNLELMLEYVFSFATYQLRNLQFFADALFEHPWLAYMFEDIMSPIFNFDDTSAYEIEKNKSLQYQITSGNIPLNDKHMTLKLNPSFMDAYKLYTNPVGSAQAALYAPLAVALDKLILSQQAQLSPATKEMFEVYGTKNEMGEVTYAEPTLTKKDLYTLLPVIGPWLQRADSGQTYEARTGSLINRLFPGRFGATQRWEPFFAQERENLLPEPKGYSLTRTLNYYDGLRLGGLSTISSGTPRKEKAYTKNKLPKRARKSYSKKMYPRYFTKPYGRKATMRKAFYKNSYQYHSSIYQKLYTKKGVSKLKLMGVPANKQNIKYKLKLVHGFFR